MGKDKTVKDHISPEVNKIIQRGNVTVAEFQEMYLNSWERDALIPAMSDGLLDEQTLYTLANCASWRQPATMYEQAIQRYAVELLKRYRKATARASAEEVNAVAERVSELQSCRDCSGATEQTRHCAACEEEAKAAIAVFLLVGFVNPTHGDL